jgi:hypothetical protein
MGSFLLVIAFLLPNGQRGVTLERFETSAQCYKAMQIVVQFSPGATASCTSLNEPMNPSMESESDMGYME